MKRQQVKPGMTVAVSPMADSQLYRVVSVNGFMVELQYETHLGWVRGGEVDVSVLRKPTGRQMSYSKQAGI